MENAVSDFRGSGILPSDKDVIKRRIWKFVKGVDATSTATVDEPMASTSKATVDKPVASLSAAEEDDSRLGSPFQQI